MVLTFDVETSTLNKGNPFSANGKLVCYSLKIEDKPTSFFHNQDLGYLNELRQQMQGASLLVGFNIKFDLHWARRHGITVPTGIRVWDCQIAEFIISGQKGSYPSLNECCAKYELGEKYDKISEYWKLGVDTQDIPVAELEVYTNLDVDLTYKVYKKQLEIMTPKQRRLCLLMGLDLLVLADMEWNGIKFDVELCKEKASSTKAELDEITKELLTYCPTPNINLDSGQQLSCLLYGGSFEVTSVVGVEKREYKSGPRKGLEYEKNIYETVVYDCPRLFTPLEGTEYKLPLKIGDKEITVYQSGEDILKQLKKPTKMHKKIIELLLKRAEVAKLMDTYYGKLPELLDTMQWGEFLHGQYNQCVAATGRLSSSNP